MIVPPVADNQPVGYDIITIPSHHLPDVCDPLSAELRTHHPPPPSQSVPFQAGVVVPAVPFPPPPVHPVPPVESPDHPPPPAYVTEAPDIELAVPTHPAPPEFVQFPVHPTQPAPPHHPPHPFTQAHQLDH